MIPGQQRSRAGESRIIDCDTMAKTGRNQPCPCGSGKKYKHCHGRFHADPAISSGGLPPDIEDQLARAKRRAEAQRLQREKQQGLGRPIVSAEVAGHRVVAVGNTVYTSKQWNVFHDFLRGRPRMARLTTSSACASQAN
jgi:hypothetical protein